MTLQHGVTRRTRKQRITAPETGKDFEGLSENTEGLNESDDENATRSPKNPKKVTRRKQRIPASEIDEDSEGSSEYVEGLEESDYENATRSLKSPKKVTRRKQRTSKATMLNRRAVQDDRLPSSPRTLRKKQEEESLLSDIAKDSWGLTKAIIKLLTVLYPVWKWLLLVYLLWMAGTYSVALTYRAALTQLAPLCSIPIIGAQISLCHEGHQPRDRPINGSKVATSQDGLTVVVERVGQNFDLARDMVGHEFAVRDLRIRVAASNLSRKQELTRELESLVRYTKQTARGFSRFTAKVGKSVDTVKTFDDYAIRALEAIAEQQRHPPTLPSRLLSAIGPLAALSFAKSVDQTEEQVRQLFISTSSRIGARVKLLMDESFELAYSLDQVQETLDRIKELAVDEVGDMPRVHVLAALWGTLARPDDFVEHRSHERLLQDMTAYYESASAVMRETNAALNRVDAELAEFRDDFATPGLILRDHPIEVIVALLRKSGQRLEAGRRQLEFIEGGGGR